MGRHSKEKKQKALESTNEVRSDSSFHTTSLTSPTTGVNVSLPVVDLGKNIGKLVIPLRVMDFIRYLCKEISAVEWSGTIFYKKASDSLVPKEFEATLHYISSP